MPLGLKQLLTTVTFKQSVVTTSATIINGALGAIFYILVARFLGVSDFGLLSVAIATLTLISDVGDFGTNTGIVNFVSRYYRSDLEKTKKFLKLAFSIKLAVGVLVLVIGFFAAPYLAELFFDKTELTFPLRIAFAGVGSVLLFSFVTSSIQALQKFFVWSAVHIVNNGLRLVFFGITLAFGYMSLTNTLWVYVTIPFLVFLIGLLFLPKGFLWARPEKKTFREFFIYNRWVAAFVVVAAFSSRLDTFISARLLSSVELGLYAAASQIVTIVPQIVSGIGTVVAPKIAEQKNIQELSAYLWKIQLMVLAIAFAGIAAIPVVLWFIPILFGISYIGSGPLFIVLLLAMLVFLISVPVHMSVFYYFQYPKLFFWVSLGHLGITMVLGWNLISAFGAMGAAVTVLVGNLFNFLVPLFWVLQRIHRQSNKLVTDN